MITCHEITTVLSLVVFFLLLLINDPQNAEKLTWRANLHFSSLFLWILCLHVPHGPDIAPVMAAAAVVSIFE